MYVKSTGTETVRQAETVTEFVEECTARSCNNSPIRVKYRSRGSRVGAVSLWWSTTAAELRCSGTGGCAYCISAANAVKGFGGQRLRRGKAVLRSREEVGTQGVGGRG